MGKLGHFVVTRRKAIIAAYLAILVPSVLGYLATPINYDLLSYMPDRLNSKKGELLLEEEFALSGLGLIMAGGKELWEINKLIEFIEEIEGVSGVVWLGDYTDIYVPLEFFETEIREKFISDDTVLVQVRFAENARSEKTDRAVREIQEIIAGDESILFGGEPAIISEMQATVEKEMLAYTIVAVGMILIILNLSLTSYLDPLLFLFSVGVAVAINLGTNMFQGEISFLTASIAAVMQLGISLDYSIFLMHRFEEEKRKYPSIEKAMAATVSRTAVAIASSALTTIGGFAALMVMQNGIGRDLGLVLGKGILISLVVNLTLLPGLVLCFYKMSNRCRHRIMLPSFKGVSHWVVKARRVFPALFFILLVPSFLAQNKVDYYYSNENFLPETSLSVQATGQIMDEFGAVDVVYVITGDEGRVREQKLVEALEKLPAVASVISVSGQVDPAIPETIIPEDLISGFKTGAYRYSLVYLTADDEQQAFEAVDTIRETTAHFHNDYYVTGSSALTRDMASLVDVDAKNVALFSIACICLILALSFRSIALPVILVSAVQLAIWINLGILYYQEQTVSSLTPIIIGAIQLGATVDYAILFTLRYRDNTLLFFSRIEAVRQTIEDTGRSILTSALTLFSATLGISIIAGIKATGEMTMLIGRGAIISMLVIFLILPAMLLQFENIIRRTTRGWAPKPVELPNKPGRKISSGGSLND